MRALLVLLPLLALVASCSKGDDHAAVTLQVNFPSAPLAIATDKVQFIVYDDPAAEACEQIYLKRITNQTDLPPVVLQSAAVPVCDLAQGHAPTLDLPFGHHSILAVGLRADADLLVGCSDVALSSTGGTVVVDLGLPSTTPLPPFSSCTALSDFCANPAACK